MGTATALLKVRDPLDKTAPALSFAAGEAPLLVTQPTPLVATVADQNLDEWKLEIAPLGSEQFRTLATGQSAIDNAPLIELDPNEFVNGFYQLLLTARDISGRESRATAAVEVNTPAKTTAYRRTETDLVWTLAGVSFALARTYDSLRRETSGGAGYGWSLDFRDVDLQTNVPATGQEPLGVFRALGEGTRQYLTLPTGARRFQLRAPARAGGGGELLPARLGRRRGRRLAAVVGPCAVGQVGHAVFRRSDGATVPSGQPVLLGT